MRTIGEYIKIFGWDRNTIIRSMTTDALSQSDIKPTLPRFGRAVELEERIRQTAVELRTKQDDIGGVHIDRIADLFEAVALLLKDRR